MTQHARPHGHPAVQKGESVKALLTSVAATSRDVHWGVRRSRRHPIEDLPRSHDAAPESKKNPREAQKLEPCYNPPPSRRNIPTRWSIKRCPRRTSAAANGSPPAWKLPKSSLIARHPPQDINLDQMPAVRLQLRLLATPQPPKPPWSKARPSKQPRAVEGVEGPLLPAEEAGFDVGQANGHCANLASVAGGHRLHTSSASSRDLAPQHPLCTQSAGLCAMSAGSFGHKRPPE
mmetsp:Transcript_19594/g.43261  ORF Transcript_19594/g.43261 Transcript_19594/m.43261 type:complete len:233 (-) Transcript_19594:8-706(-)